MVFGWGFHPTRLGVPNLNAGGSPCCARWRGCHLLQQIPRWCFFTQFNLSLPMYTYKHPPIQSPLTSPPQFIPSQPPPHSFRAPYPPTSTQPPQHQHICIPFSLKCWSLQFKNCIICTAAVNVPIERASYVIQEDIIQSRS